MTSQTRTEFRGVKGSLKLLTSRPLPTTSTAAESNKEEMMSLNKSNLTTASRLKGKCVWQLERFTAMLALTTLGCLCQGMANAQEVNHVDGLTVITVQAGEAPVDFVNA